MRIHHCTRPRMLTCTIDNRGTHKRIIQWTGQHMQGKGAAVDRELEQSLVLLF